MKTSRHKTYFALLGLGGTALLVDRLALTRPASEPWEAAAAESPADRSAVRGDLVPGAGTPQGIPELPFPGGLAALGFETSVHDLFTPPTRRADVARLGRSAEGGGCLGSGVAAHRSFAESHRLNAILQESDVHIAVVGGELVQPGGTIGGCVLKKLEGTKAHFACEDGEAVLELSADSENP